MLVNKLVDSRLLDFPSKWSILRPLVQHALLVRFTCTKKMVKYKGNHRNIWIRQLINKTLTFDVGGKVILLSQFLGSFGFS